MTNNTEERIRRLEMALFQLVYFDDSTPPPRSWHVNYLIDTDVSDVIGDLLDEYQPKE